MRVYISGPITGVENYKEKFNKAQKDAINDIFEKAYEKLLLFLDN